MGIIQEIRDDIASVYRVPTNKDLNVLAALLVVIPSLIGLYGLLWKENEAGYYWIAAGAAFGALRLIRPAFVGFHRLWIRLSVVLGYFVSRILLTLVFFLTVTPIGLLMRLTGRDPMNRKLDPNASTYWHSRESQTPSVEMYERQF
jgi:hypothetical protein